MTDKSKRGREICVNFYRFVLGALAADMGGADWSRVNDAEVEAIGAALQALDDAVTAASDRFDHEVEG